MKKTKEVWGIEAKRVLGFVFATVSIALFAQSSVVVGQTAQVFRIGSFDRSALEFRGGNPIKPVLYIVSPSASPKSWYAKQYVDESAEASGPKRNIAAEPRTVQFELRNEPAAAYCLHVAALLESLSVPALRVEIDGKAGTFYLDSKLESSMGGMDESSESRLSSADVNIEFPGKMLHKGTNTIRFEVVRASQDIIADSSLTYDAIELDSIGSPALLPNAQILPTIFFKKQPNGLSEMVNVFIRCDDRCSKGEPVDLTIEGKVYRQTFDATQDFGEQRLEFLVSGFTAGASAHLTWMTASGQHEFQKEIYPQKQWTLLIVPHIHLDVGYSDYQSKVAAIQSRAIDEAMDLTTGYPGFKFSMDGSWVLEQFMKTRVVADQQRAIAAMKKQELFMPADYDNELTEIPSAEILIRSLYFSANFSREHGTPFDYASLTDVPSHAWAYASILASAGIKYFVAGPNGAEWRAPILLGSHLDEQSPYWWQGPDGQKVLAWYSRHYQEMEVFFGKPPSLIAAHQTLPLFFKTYERSDYHADSAILYGSQVENTDLFPQQAQFARDWNGKYAYPRIKYSGFREALQSIASQAGNAIPTVVGGGGGYWEDGIASDARYAAIERGNEAHGPSAEKLATLASLVNPLIAVDKTKLDLMWNDMVLMDEHTWTAHNSFADPDGEQAVEQLAVKNQYAVNAQALADWVTRSSMASLADSISVGRNSIVVFNTLNWTRSGSVDIDLNKGNEIFDTESGRVVPTELIRADTDLNRVRFLASDVLAVGYKIYQIRHSQAVQKSMEDIHGDVLESPFYRVELDPATGAIRSIYDKELKRELVNLQSPYRLGQYIYVSGGDKRPNGVLLYQPEPFDSKLHVATSYDGHLLSIIHEPTGMVARLESTAMNTPGIVTEVRLFDNEKKIEIDEDVDKTEVHQREAVYFAFPFNMSHPQFQYEIADGVIDPSKNIYQGGDQSWFTVQHWVSVQQDGVSATVMPMDASLVTLGDINRGLWLKKFGVRPGNIFSYVMNNYWNTNYVGGQGGHFRFRYVITSAATTNAIGLSRTAWEEVTPLEKNEVTTQDKAVARPVPLTSKQTSLLRVDDKALLLEDWKPAEDGDGTILRFLDMGGASRSVSVKVPFIKLTRVVQTDSVERDIRPLELTDPHRFSFTVKPHEIVTIRMVGSIDIHAMAQTWKEAK